ncbi:MAG: RNA polymerase sigma factor [Oscillospiraceae bacterium]
MDKEEFEALFLPCQGALTRFVRWRIGNPADADDVLQETILLVYRNRDKLKNTTSFKPWMLQIARNQCNEYYRRNAGRDEVPLSEDVAVGLFSKSSERSLMVRDILEHLPQTSRKILCLSYFNDLPQAEIARLLGVPVGTVKSRLYTEKKQFRAAYEPKGEKHMRKLPSRLPEYTISPSDQPPFAVKWEEMLGWFAVPCLGKTCTWAIYDCSSRQRQEQYAMKVTGNAVIHGIKGVEIVAEETLADGKSGINRSFVAQLTDTHCRILAESHMENEVKCICTFLDSDDFLPNWGFGEDNCGNNIYPVPRGMIQRDGACISCPNIPSALDVVGRYTVTIGGRAYDTILVMDIENDNGGVLSETYLDQTGRTVLWRRFNRNDWNMKRNDKPWSEQLPDNARLTVNGICYVHWYDCITDHIL